MSGYTEAKLEQHDPSGGNIGLYAKGHGYVAFVGLGSVEHFEAAQRQNARRLVACWNACEHIPTEALERFESIKAAGTASMESVLAESAELVAALRQHDGWLDRTGHGADHPWRLSIARALAKHTPKVKA